MFRSPAGRRADPDGRFVLLADYSHGIVLEGRRIFGIQNGMAPARLVRFDLDPAGERIRSATIVDRHQPLADEPTIATILGRNLIDVAHSQGEKFDDHGRRKPGTTLAPAVLLALKIR